MSPVYREISIGIAAFVATVSFATDVTHSAGVHKDGELSVSGLSAAVEIVRDELSVPTITAETFDDVIRAQGFVHAQERFFQMDAGRRLAAGELAELAPPLIDMDRQYRPYRFRAVAEQVLDRLDESERHWLEVYAEGVNAGLEHLPARPFEYGTINADPKPWRPEDSILVYLAMFDFLHMEASFERRLHVMHEALPKELFAFLTPNATRFDEPLITTGGNPSNDWQPMDIPGPEVIDLREHSRADIDRIDDLHDLVEVAPPALGSNNWAVAGSRSHDGRAIVANDPHLRLSAPGIWYRADLRWREDDDDRQSVGLTLPGAPGVVIGSNGNVAWGFTNMMGDFQDLVVIEVNPDNEHEYRTPDGWEEFETITERINVRGRGAQTLELKKTRWGVVTDHDHHGRPLVLKWTALDPELVDLSIINMSFAKTLEQGVDIAANWGGPAQNVLLADDTGRIAWVISGHLPKRFGFDGRYPVSWADGDVGWDGMIAAEDKPRVIDPADGILFTANNRTVDVQRAREIGGVWTAGERANRIAHLLRNGDAFTESDLFDLQLDTRIELFDFYRDLALHVMQHADEGHDAYDEAQKLLEQWNGTADADQPAVQLLELFRRQLHLRIIGPLVAPARQLDERFAYRWFMDEEPVRRLLEEQPMHMLNPRYFDWDDLVESEWRNTLSRFSFVGRNLNTPWGEANRSRIEHPLVMGMPMLAEQLNLPSDPQPGHPFALRVATPSFGASARLSVSPGHEEDGILHIPGGQSGHPHSPHYSSGHDAWANGTPLPLLGGSANATLKLVPR